VNATGQGIVTGGIRQSVLPMEHIVVGVHQARMRVRRLEE
jgi:hypothetical protein